MAVALSDAAEPRADASRCSLTFNQPYYLARSRLRKVELPKLTSPPGTSADA